MPSLRTVFYHDPSGPRRILRPMAVELTKEHPIGKGVASPPGLLLSDEFASRHHADLVIQDSGEMTWVNQSPTNVTQLFRSSANEWVRLGPTAREQVHLNDRIIVGRTELEIWAGSAEEFDGWASVPGPGPKLPDQTDPLPDIATEECD